MSTILVMCEQKYYLQKIHSQPTLMVLKGPGHTQSKKVAYSKVFFSNAIWDYVNV